MLESIDKFHIIDKIKRIPILLIFEIIIIIFFINLIFSFIYYKIYKNDPTSFKDIHNLNSKNPITFYDFLYFSHTTFYSLGYDIVPNTKISKFICVIHLKISFIIMAIYIGKILK
jgi:hypothetical protein